MCKPAGSISLLIFICLISIVPPSQSALGQKHDEIPSPRNANPPGWVVDLTHSVPEFAVNQLNELCSEIHEFKNAELAVVVIRSTDGKFHRQYATDLFNHWGIGDSRANNGVLLFVALDDRKAELILGDGIDTAKTRAEAQKIMDQFIIPRFKKGDMPGALYGGAFGSARNILGINDLATKIPTNALVPEQGSRVRKSRRSRGIAPWMLFGGLALIGGVVALFGSRYWMRYGRRKCPECHFEMVMLGEDEDDEHLNKPERIEERIGSVDYDVWGCRSCEEVIKFRYGRFFTRYSSCPQCNYKTRSKIERTLRAATTSHGGRVRVDENCAHCDYRETYTYSTPRLQKSTSSGSGFSSGGGFSGGGGGGSGFGGGSSSGGGASGGW